MGQIIFHCTHCGTKLSAQLDEVGQEFECPQCQRLQTVPGGQPAPAAQTSPGTPIKAHTTGGSAGSGSGSGSGMPVVRIPKRKIVMSTAAAARDDKDDDEDLEEIGGSGVGLFAVALGTAGLLLCCLSMLWMVLVQQEEQGGNWWLSLMIFLATFLMGLMGLVLSQLARLVVRLADRVSRITED